MQSRILPIARLNVTESVTRELRNLIVDGRLPAGERINEVHVAQQLGVSRTPLREALARLAQEGALRNTAGIGYFVRDLTLEEFEQVYSIRPLLDPEALRLAGLPPSDRVERLERLNAKIEKARDANVIIDLDDAWHLELIADCPNRVLIELIQHFSLRTRRYEIALMREQKNVSVTVANHRAIMAALRRRDLEGAIAALRVNLASGRAPIVEWLAAREAARATGKRA
jgi:DNA-binding GntR family transcriptional regulator